jgi:hypothetical protein
MNGRASEVTEPKRRCRGCCLELTTRLARLVDCLVVSTSPLIASLENSGARLACETRKAVWPASDHLIQGIAASRRTCPIFLAPAALRFTKRRIYRRDSAPQLADAKTTTTPSALFPLSSPNGPMPGCHVASPPGSVRLCFDAVLSLRSES